ncbi:hypothetical protein [Leptolyngbya sp. 'hensonii']|uniref:hypothetical protein n=1 Tax=Leptolyngbya sp. 'hensonii' TaxID=1922337 RepID=UPI000AFAB7EB|nr:hypothetical protein [Leptolyngbya sp. 'hensonii']
MAVSTSACLDAPLNVVKEYVAEQNNSSFLPISVLKSGQFLAIPENCRGGLIVEKKFYADLVGPGAAVGAFFDSHCTNIYLVGQVRLWAPTTYFDQQQAFRKRMACNRRLQTISHEPSSMVRAHEMLMLLYQWLGAEEAAAIPSEWVARLAGVLPKTVDLVKSMLHSRTISALKLL